MVVLVVVVVWVRLATRHPLLLPVSRLQWLLLSTAANFAGVVC
jgi:hypothetical protein